MGRKKGGFVVLGAMGDLGNGVMTKAMKPWRWSAFVFLWMALMTGCATIPYFAIENKSDDEIKIEFVFDTLNLKHQVAKYIIERSPKEQAPIVCFDDPACDSIVQLLEVDKGLFSRYMYDSLTLRSFLFYSDDLIPPPMGAMAIQRTQSSDNTALDENERINFDQSLLEYYDNDSTLVQRIISDQAVTLLLPANHILLNQCPASGDLSCDIEDAFPNCQELRVVPAKDSVIVLTKANFKHKMKNKTVQRESDSYLLEIELP